MQDKATDASLPEKARPTVGGGADVYAESRLLRKHLKWSIRLCARELQQTVRLHAALCSSRQTASTLRQALDPASAARPGALPSKA